MDQYELHDGRFIQELARTSAANATQQGFPAVPVGKVWFVLSAGYSPSVSETKIVEWFLLTKSTAFMPIRGPESIALTAVFSYPIVTEGMEIKLFPGESLICLRDSATAGSIMTIFMRFIEIDLPFYSYEEPLNKVIRATQKHSTLLRGGGGGGGRSGPGSGPGGGGGGGGPEPR